MKSDDKYGIGIRLCAACQVGVGKSSKSLESGYLTSFKQITNWFHRFETGGLDRLRDKPGRSRTGRLTWVQRWEIVEKI